MKVSHNIGPLVCTKNPKSIVDWRNGQREAALESRYARNLPSTNNRVCNCVKVGAYLPTPANGKFIEITDNETVRNVVPSTDFSAARS